MAGEYLHQFFAERGYTEIKPNGEMDVCCPFPHDKGFETRPSAHINVEKAVFHCKTCRAEGRWNEGGLSEIGFIAAFHKCSYSEALQMMKVFDGSSVDDSWQQAVENLLTQTKMMEWLENRGITREAVVEYELGYLGTGPTYPVKMNGIILDKREYDIDWKEKKERGERAAKIKSQRGASPLLFPFDHWQRDNRPTLLVAGENDALLARIQGFNGLTTTGGEGNFPKMFAGLFRNKRVYICYDCDEAGHKGALKVAFILKEAGADVFIVDLGLAGTADDKDITDFFIKHGKTPADLIECIGNAKPYSGEMYQEAKNENYPLVNLWDVVEGKYHGKHISSRVQMMGKYDRALGIPAAVEYGCRSANPESNTCLACPLFDHQGESNWWVIDEKSLDKVLKLAEESEDDQNKVIKRDAHIPNKCPGGFWKRVREWKHVWKVILAPDAETEDELTGYRFYEHMSYVLANSMDDGQKYRVYMKCYPHPKTSAIVGVVDRVEDSDNSINTFKMSPAIMQELSQFQGDPFEQHEKRLAFAKRLVHPSAPRLVVETVNIMYHSVLDFKFAGRLLDKGHPEILIVSESQGGKSTTSRMLMQLYGVGNFTNCKDASAVGLKGGVADSGGMAGQRIKWGVIPRNHMGLVILDELSGMSKENFASLTYMRSERRADIKKIASGDAPAKTRLLWLSNPREQSDGTSKPVALYSTGVQIGLELVGKDEDLARFDAVVVLPTNNVYIDPFTAETLSEKDYDRQSYRHLIYWVWSRTADQVKWAENVERYLWARVVELNEKYDTRVKLFGPKATNKVARIAVSCAAMCFSHDGTGEAILVQKEHVDWAVDFLVRCYDNSTFRLPLFVQQERSITETNEEINAIFGGLVRSQGQLMKQLSNYGEMTLQQLRYTSGLDEKDFGTALSNLAQHGLIQSSKYGVSVTMRFRLAQEAYINALGEQRLIPLSQQGDLPI